jgi:predicted RND superfamily exporter protein
MANRIKSLLLKIYDNPLKSLVLLSLFGALLSPGLQKLEKNYLMRYWVEAFDPLVVKLDVFTRHFGNDETIVAAIETKEGIFQKNNIKKIKNFIKEIDSLNNISNVLSIYDFQYMRIQKDKIKVGGYVDSDDLSQEELFRRQTLARNDRLAKDLLISQDGKTALIYARLVPTEVIAGETISTVDYKVLNQNLRQITKKYENDFKISLSGNGVIQYEFLNLSEQDVNIIFPIMMSLFLGLVYFIFRTISSVVIVNTVIWVTIIWTFGFGGLLGVKLESVVASTPMILITICMADSIHLLHYFYDHFKKHGDKRAAVEYSLQNNITTTFLTSMTTAIGFSTLLSSSLVPIYNLGLLASFGTMLAWPVSLATFVLTVRYLVKKAPENRKLFKKYDLNLKSYVQKLTHRKPRILLSFLVITAIMYALGSQNEVNSTPIEWFRDSHPVKKDTMYILDKVGAASGPEILAHSGADRDIIKPNFLYKLDKLVQRLEAHPRIKKVINPIGVIKELNRLKNGTFSIPNDENEVMNLFFDYRKQLGSQMKVNDRVTQDFEALRLSILWDIPDTKTGAATVKWFYQQAKEVGLEIDVTGKSAFYLEMNEYVVSTFFQSMGWAIFFIFIVFIMLYRSFKFAVLSILPNLIPVGFAIGVMKIFGINIDIGTAIVCSCCLGIAVDDTIHFIFHYKKYSEKHSPQESIEHVLKETGVALITTTSILVLGFGLFTFGRFVPNFNFGLICSVTLLMALVADLVVLPALLLKSNSPS